MDISSVSSVPANTPVGRLLEASAARDSSRAQPHPIRREEDQVEVSDVATYLGKMKLLPPIRQELVDSIRHQIQSGSYETPERIDGAIDELIRDLRG